MLPTSGTAGSAPKPILGGSRVLRRAVHSDRVKDGTRAANAQFAAIRLLSLAAVA